jgi:fucose 4-O-acetylase-like acetyltransferase
MKENIQRNQYWDILKGLGIIAIVIGHSGSPLIPFVYMYHITLFFFISGSLYKNAYSTKPVIYVWRRIKSLYWPFVKYGLGLLIFHNVLLRIGVLSTKAEPGIITTGKYNMSAMFGMAQAIVSLKTTEQMVGAMWFIPLLFIACILFCLIRYFSIKLAGKYSVLTTGTISVALFAVGVILAQEHVFL